MLMELNHSEDSLNDIDLRFYSSFQQNIRNEINR